MTLSSRYHVTRTYPSCSLALLLGAGCLSSTHDLGDTPEQRVSDLEQPPVSDATPQARFASEFDGLWLGQAEDPLGLAENSTYRFPSGSTRILLRLGPGESTLTFGEGPSLPPPTDPDVGYPPNAESYLIESSPLHPWEGYPYPVWEGPFRARDLFATSPTDYFDPDTGWFDRESRLIDEGRVIDGRRQLVYDVEDLFQPWCDLQAPDGFCGSEDLQQNGPSMSVNYEENTCAHPYTDEPMDCGKAYLCYFHCPLRYATERPPLPVLELRLAADGLLGVFSRGAAFLNERGFLTPLGTVRFRRLEE